MRLFIRPPPALELPDLALVPYPVKGASVLVAPAVLCLPALADGAAFLPLPPFLATSAVSFLPVRAIHVAVPSAARHLRPTGGHVRN